MIITNFKQIIKNSVNLHSAIDFELINLKPRFKQFICWLKSRFLIYFNFYSKDSNLPKFLLYTSFPMFFKSKLFLIITVNCYYFKFNFLQHLYFTVFNFFHLNFFSKSHYFITKFVIIPFSCLPTSQPFYFAKLINSARYLNQLAL